MQFQVSLKGRQAVSRRSYGVRPGRLKRYGPSLQAGNVWLCRQQEAVSSSQHYKHPHAHIWILNSDSQKCEKRFVCLQPPGFWAFMTQDRTVIQASGQARRLPVLLVTLQCRRTNSTSCRSPGLSAYWAALDTLCQELLVSLEGTRQLGPRQVPEYKAEDSIGLISRRVGARWGEEGAL